MAFESTITEKDFDKESLAFVQSLKDKDGEPDLDVDGMHDSILARLARLFRLA